ncbi:MAG TPA: hypothetical protein VN894_17670 [Polyangiaceae bacterium]|nr:hypothetical protein [Polyangiaceae bacterium]
MQPRKIRVADIERLRRTLLENVPESRVEEVTTVEAVRMPTSEIHAMQAKGYGLRTIGELLSENRVVMTTATLKNYLSQAKMAGRKKSGAKTKTRREADSAAEGTAPATESKAGGEGSAASIDRQEGARVVTKAPPGVRTPSPPAAMTTTIAKGIARPDDRGARRSAFVPKEDTRDI